MKWTNGLTWEEKVRRRGIYHRWFAWHPVIVSITDDGRRVKVWWEYVERKGHITQFGWTYCYREIEKGKLNENLSKV